MVCKASDSSIMLSDFVLRLVVPNILHFEKSTFWFERPSAKYAVEEVK